MVYNMEYSDVTVSVRMVLSKENRDKCKPRK